MLAPTRVTEAGVEPLADGEAIGTLPIVAGDSLQDFDDCWNNAFKTGNEGVAEFSFQVRLPSGEERQLHVHHDLFLPQRDFKIAFEGTICLPSGKEIRAEVKYNPRFTGEKVGRIRFLPEEKS